MSEQKKEQPKKPPPKQPTKRFTYWVTRDADPDTGQVSPTCRVWLTSPRRHTLDRGSFWLGRARDDLYGEWTLEQCYYYCKVTPDDDRQCIRVEGDIEWQPGSPVRRPTASA